MATTTHRVPARELDGSELDRELAHLHETRHDTFLHGSADALEAHTERMLELEQEYVRRFPQRTAPEPMRTRAGSRRMDGRG